MFGFAVSKKAKPPENEWRIKSVAENTMVYAQMQMGTPEGILYEGDSAAIVPTLFSKLKDGYAITKIDRNGLVIWQTAIEGSILAMSRMGKNIVAFTETIDKESDRLTGRMIDPRTGRVVKEKIIYQVNSLLYQGYECLKHTGWTI